MWQDVSSRWRTRSGSGTVGPVRYVISLDETFTDAYCGHHRCIEGAKIVYGEEDGLDGIARSGSSGNVCAWTYTGIR